MVISIHTVPGSSEELSLPASGTMKLIILVEDVSPVNDRDILLSSGELRLPYFPVTSVEPTWNGLSKEMVMFLPYSASNFRSMPSRVNPWDAFATLTCCVPKAVSGVESNFKLTMNSYSSTSHTRYRCIPSPVSSVEKSYFASGCLVSKTHPSSLISMCPRRSTSYPSNPLDVAK